MNSCFIAENFIYGENVIIFAIRFNLGILYMATINALREKAEDKSLSLINSLFALIVAIYYNNIPKYNTLQR